VAFAPVADSMPPKLIADRTRLYFGAAGDMAYEANDIPHTLSQLRAQLGWIEDQLIGKSPFLHGRHPSMSDLLVWTVVWFIKGRFSDAAQLLSEFPSVLAWSTRMDAIGHGTFDTMTPEQAVAVAKDATATTPEQTDAADPQGLRPGMNVSVTPLTDSGESGVTGTILALCRDRIALARHDALCGDVVVHFPRVGYRVSSI